MFSNAKGEVTRGIEIVEFACGAPNLLRKPISAQQHGGGIDNWNLHNTGRVRKHPHSTSVMVPLWTIQRRWPRGTSILKPWGAAVARLLMGATADRSRAARRCVQRGAG